MALINSIQDPFIKWINWFWSLFLFSRNIKSLSDIQIVQVACGYYHSLALSKGKYCFFIFLPFYSFITWYLNWAERSPTLFLFKIVLVLFDLFHIHIHFRISLPVFTDTQILGFWLGLNCFCTSVLGKSL